MSSPCLSLSSSPDYELSPTQRNGGYHESTVSGRCSGGDARCSAASVCPRGARAGGLRLVLGLHFRYGRRVGVLVLGSAEGVVVRGARRREGSSHYPNELTSDLLESVVRLAPSLFEPAGVLIVGSGPFLFLERFVQSAAPSLVPKRGNSEGLAFSH